MENKGRKWFFTIVSIILALAILVGVGYAMLTEKMHSQSIEGIASDYDEEEKDRYGKRALNLVGGEAIIPSGMEKAEVKIFPDTFVEKNKYGFFNNRKINCEVSASFLREENLLLCFEAQAEIEFCQIKVELYGTQRKALDEAVFYANTQASIYYYPISRLTNIKKIVFTASDGEGGITIKRCTLLNNHETEIPKHISGSFVTENIKGVVSRTPDISLVSALDTICNDKYLYTVSNNILTISSLSNAQRPAVIGKLDGLGRTRRVIIVKEGLLAVACLEYGVYLIDVSNPRAPKKVGHIDALEASAGITAKGDYLFIASGYSGVEIFDISDPANPKFCSVSRSNEDADRVDCEVYEDFLYVSVHSPNRIEVFDIGNVNKPRFLGYITTDGTPYGLDIYNGNLVISTGFHSSKSDHDAISQVGYGMGNGIEIHSLKYPERPKFVSIIKADGRYFHSGYDFWNVRVAGNYAYYTDMHNGLYVFDISNVKNPTRVCKMTVKYDSENEVYKDIDRSASVFSFDTATLLQGSINGAAIYNGYVYITESSGGVHVMKYDNAVYEEKERTAMFGAGEQASDKKYLKRNLDVTKAKFEGQTFVAEEHGDYIFVGTSKGIAVLDRDMKQKNFYKTDGAVRDLKVTKSRLYAAQSEAGIAVYSINESKLSKIGGYKSGIRSGRIGISTQIMTSPDGRYIITNFCSSDVIILDAADVKNIFICDRIGVSSIAQRNIGQGYLRGNTVFVRHSLGMVEVVFNEDGTITQKKQDNPTGAVVGVFAKYDENTVLSIGDDGYRMIDVSEAYYRYRLGERIKVINLLLDGLPVIKDDMLVVTNRASGNVGIIDITNTVRPQLTGIINVAGTVDRAFIASNNSIYIPARYDGLIRINVTD